MAMPIDFKEVIDAFGDIDAARQQPVSVFVLVDPSAPDDVADFAKECFATTEVNARVSIAALDSLQPDVPFGCDLVVVVAAFADFVGPLCAKVRAAGTPVLVVTTMPDIVSGLAQAAGAPLLAADMVAPKALVVEGALPDGSSYNQEPYPIDDARAAALKQAMGEWIVNVFRDKKLAFALCFPFVRKPLSLEAVKATSAQNAAVGAVVLIPGADMPVMTLNQAKMILQIAAAYGQKMGMERAKELVGVVGGAFALRTAARQVVGAVPGFGWAVKGGIGYAGTQAMGRAAIAYFESSVGQGKPVAEALDAARAEAQRAAAIANAQSNPKDALSALAHTYAGNAVDAVRGAASAAVPAAKGVVENVAQAAGSTPADLGKKMVDSVSEVTGKTPSQLGRVVAKSILRSRRGRGN